MSSNFLPCEIKAVEYSTNISTSDVDSYVVVQDDGMPSDILNYITETKKIDKGFDSEVSCFKHDNRLVIHSPLDINDYSDVREYFKSAKKGIERAVKAGSVNPSLILPSRPKYKNAELSTILGALSALYVPIQYREEVPEKAQRIKCLYISWSQKDQLQDLIEKAKWLESGLYICRDIGGGDPERMSPPNVAAYVEKAFTSGKISINIISDQDLFVKEYPLFAAVNRAARSVPRHQGRIIWMEYKPPKPARKTLMLVGKGVTYDTGGADIKAGGIMAGMSRDKCGAAAIAGFMKTVELRQPEDVHVIAALCMVRNSVGEECYVADEVMTSRAGVRIRIGNTDAEGRMAMADSLCVMKERAVKENLPNCFLYTIATLTGHACIALGDYTGVLDNKVAENAGHNSSFCKAGALIGDPSEISTVRKEDFEFNRSKGYGEDLLQCNNAPSSRTPRGHQIPAAFLIVASGLDKHDASSSIPLKYTHLDVAGSAGDVPDQPTGAPLLSLSQLHLL
ncbi:putative aminopeptidase W07G4.4 [Chironomus tepperi]|uniref:putative aminopeptidase W07G4.4 n=1 Tax=Chironomus tepperi TaxID=113505 RepID=UPI00391FAF0B